MWTIFSRDPSKDFPYEITKCPNYEFNQKSLWELKKGRKKNTVQKVSIFEFTVQNNLPGSESRLTFAQSAVKHLKTLKHPNILSFLESYEVKNQIYLSTEYVKPLQHFVSCQKDLHTYIMKQYIAWGIFNIIKGLQFLNFEAKLCHNKVCIWSVFINKGGDFKLGELEYMNSVNNSLPSYINELYRTPGHEQSQFSIDVWGLGVLIWEIFNNPLNHQSALKNVNKIPKEILNIYLKMMAENPKNRPSYDSIISALRKQEYFGNDLEKTMTSLIQYNLLDNSQRTEFLEKLPSLIEYFPKNLTLYNVWPRLFEIFNYVKDQKNVFPSMIKLSIMLEDNEFEVKVVPCIIQLFESNDRAIRLMLLNTIELYANRLKPELLNTSIFPLLVSGLKDTNPIIKELTIRSMVHISSKLNFNNLNLELMQHFARLQMKDQDSIRTNTTVCLGKIAQYLDPKIRSKILSSAFHRALKDPFSPSRLAGVSAFSATQQYYSLHDISNRVLPALCQVTLDPEKEVRDKTFLTIKGFLTKLENISEDDKFKNKIEDEINTNSSSVPTWTNWAVSSVTSKLYSTIKSDKEEKLIKNKTDKEEILNNSFVANDNLKNISKQNQVDDDVNTLQNIQNYKNSTNESTFSNGWENDFEWDSIDSNDENSCAKSTNFENERIQIDFDWKGQNSLSLDNTNNIKKKEVNLMKKDTMNHEKQERINRQESKRNNKTALKLGGKKL